MRLADVAQRAPDRAVALEAAAEAELPQAVALAHAARVLDVAQDVPARAQPCCSAPGSREATVVNKIRKHSHERGITRCSRACDRGKRTGRVSCRGAAPATRHAPGSSTDHSKEPNHIARPAAKHRTVQRSLMTSAPCTASQRLGTQGWVGHGQAPHQVDAADVLPKRCSVARAGATCGACAKVSRSPSVSYAQAVLQMQPRSGYHAQARHAAAWVMAAVSAPASLDLRELGNGAGGSRKRAGLARAPDQARGPAPSRARPGCRARPCAAGSARTRATGSSRRRWPGPAAWLPARAVGDTRCCLPCGLGTHGSGVRTPRALAYSWHGCDGCKQARPCCPA